MMNCQEISKGWTAEFRQGVWKLYRQTLGFKLWRGDFETKQAAQAAASNMVAEVRRKAQSRS